MKKNFPFYGWIGVFLTLIFWYLNWMLEGSRSQWAFFPLWLGYILVVDALVYKKKGNSLLTRNFFMFLFLFIVSIPCWWLFEVLNDFTGYWIYEGRQLFSDTEFFILATIAFSTVTPAVFETAELASTFRWIKNLGRGPVVSPDKTISTCMFIAGWIMLVLVLLWPRYFPYFMWISVYFILEPLNIWLKFPALLKYTNHGDWRPVIALFTGSLICGFFWEMWNYFSYPKWIYDVPNHNFLHVFEMPLLGYLGYLPFALELYALYHLIAGFIFKEKARTYFNLEF